MKQKRLKKFVTALTLAAVIGTQAGNVMGASVRFNATLVTRANSESFEKIIAKDKADNEQYWYMTLTGSKNLGTKGDPRAIMASALSPDKAVSTSDLLGLYKNMYGTQRVAYSKKAIKGKNYKLYASGNNNAKRGYTIKLVGRYTS